MNAEPRSMILQRRQSGQALADDGNRHAGHQPGLKARVGNDHVVDVGPAVLGDRLANLLEQLGRGQMPEVIAVHPFRHQHQNPLILDDVVNVDQVVLLDPGGFHVHPRHPRHFPTVGRHVGITVRAVEFQREREGHIECARSVREKHDPLTAGPQPR
jgi:hypothetical protein